MNPITEIGQYPIYGHDGVFCDIPFMDIPGPTTDWFFIVPKPVMDKAFWSY